MLRRFFDYTDKVFGLSKLLSEITDTRPRPQISIRSILMSSFIMHLTRLGSLNALDAELRLPKRIENFIGKDRPSVDTIGRVFADIDPDQLRTVLWNNCYQLKRNKAIDSNLPLNAVGIDGHEFFSH